MMDHVDASGSLLSLGTIADVGCDVIMTITQTMNPSFAITLPDERWFEF